MHNVYSLLTLFEIKVALLFRFFVLAVERETSPKQIAESQMLGNPDPTQIANIHYTHIHIYIYMCVIGLLKSSHWQQNANQIEEICKDSKQKRKSFNDPAGSANH